MNTKKILISFILLVASIFTVTNVKANTITETTKEDNYDTIKQNTIIIKISKFDDGYIVTDQDINLATDNYYDFLNGRITERSIYIYLGNHWYDITDINNPIVIDDNDIFEQLDIYYINNIEKQIKIPYEVELKENYYLKFITNNENKEVKYEESQLIIPSTLTHFDIIATDGNNEKFIDSFRRENSVFDTDTIAVSNLEELKNAIENKANIKLLNDITDIDEPILIDYMINLNGNNKKLIFKDDVELKSAGLIINSDNANIVDLSIEMNGSNSGIEVYDSSNVTINGLDSQYGQYALLINGSSVILKDEINVSNNEFAGIKVFKQESLENNSHLVIEGNIVMDDEDIDKPIIILEPEQGTVEDEKLIATDRTNDANLIYYYSNDSLIVIDIDTLEKLKEEIILGGNLRLISDITLDDSIAINEDVVVKLDLNSHNITSNNQTLYPYSFINSGQFTIEDNIGEGFISSRNINNIGTMIINNGKFISLGILNEGNLIINDGNFMNNLECLINNGNAIINGGEFINNDIAFAINSTGTIEINNNTIISGTNGGIAILSGNAIINDGNFSSPNSNGLYIANDGDGINLQTAHVIINGGNFDGNQSSLLIGNDINKEFTSKIEIANGKFNNTFNLQTNLNNKENFKITGGIYIFDPSDYLEEEYEAIEENNWYTVVETN